MDQYLEWPGFEAPVRGSARAVDDRDVGHAALEQHARSRRARVEYACACALVQQHQAAFGELHAQRLVRLGKMDASAVTTPLRYPPKPAAQAQQDG